MTATFHGTSRTSSPRSNGTPGSHVQDMSPGNQSRALPVRTITEVKEVCQLVFVRMQVEVLGRSERLFALRAVLKAISRASYQVFLPPKRIVIPSYSTTTILNVSSQRANRPKLGPTKVSRPIPTSSRQVSQRDVGRLIIRQLRRISFRASASIVQDPPTPNVVQGGKISLRGNLKEPTTNDRHTRSIIASRSITHASQFRPMINIATGTCSNRR